MNGFLNVLKYLLVIVVVVLGFGLIICGCLILIPGMNIFGISYISYDKKIVEQQIDATEVSNSVNLVRINSGAFDVELDVVDTNQITNGANFVTCRLSRLVSGFVVGDEDQKNITIENNYEQDGSTKILNINVKQPEKAWLFPTETILKLYVPQTLLGGKNVEIISTSGKVKVGSTPVYDSHENLTNDFLHIKSLNIKDDSGTVNLGCVNLLEPLEIEKEKGDINSELDLAVTTTLSVKSGFGSITLKNVGSSTNPKDLVLKNIWNSSININTIYGSLVAQELVGGNIKIQKLVGESDITNDYADFHFGEISATMKYQANDGLFEVSKMFGKLTLNQKAGTIKITDLGTNISALTHDINSGNASLKISKLHDSVQLVSQDGDINVWGVVEDNQRLNLNIKSKNGKVNLYNIDGTVVYDGKEGNSSIHTEYANFVGKNTYINKTGEIEVVMPYDKNPAMWIDWETEKTASIKLSSFESHLKLSYGSDEYVDNYGISINDATTSTQEKLQIATKLGDIVVYRKSVTQ